MKYICAFNSCNIFCYILILKLLSDKQNLLYLVDIYDLNSTYYEEFQYSLEKATKSKSVFLNYFQISVATYSSADRRFQISWSNWYALNSDELQVNQKESLKNKLLETNNITTNEFISLLEKEEKNVHCLWYSKQNFFQDNLIEHFFDIKIGYINQKYLLRLFMLMKIRKIQIFPVISYIQENRTELKINENVFNNVIYFLSEISSDKAMNTHLKPEILKPLSYLVQNLSFSKIFITNLQKLIDNHAKKIVNNDYNSLINTNSVELRTNFLFWKFDKYEERIILKNSDILILIGYLIYFNLIQVANKIEKTKREIFIYNILLSITYMRNTRIYLPINNDIRKEIIAKMENSCQILKNDTQICFDKMLLIYESCDEDTIKSIACEIQTIFKNSTDVVFDNLKIIEIVKFFEMIPYFLFHGIHYSNRISHIFAVICIVYDTKLKNIAKRYIKSDVSKWIDLHDEKNQSIDFALLMFKVEDIALNFKEKLLIRALIVISRLSKYKHKNVYLNLTCQTNIKINKQKKARCQKNHLNIAQKLYKSFFKKSLSNRIQCSICKSYNSYPVTKMSKLSNTCSSCKKCYNVCFLNKCEKCTKSSYKLSEITEFTQLYCCKERFNEMLQGLQIEITYQDFFKYFDCLFLGFYFDNPCNLNTKKDIKLLLKVLQSPNYCQKSTTFDFNNEFIHINYIMFEVNNLKAIKDEIYASVFRK